MHVSLTENNVRQKRRLYFSHKCLYNNVQPRSLGFGSPLNFTAGRYWQENVNFSM